jgi:16S rRNA (cytidine1402-2'-O)-methyltransferase
MESGMLYIVATPIGNLKDITLRALETLKKVDLVACEDTRITKKLLDRFEIKKPLTSFFQYSKAPKISQIIAVLKSGKNVALVTDAGTPGISDPGNRLVEAVILEGVAVMPIPGVSALTTLASVAGIDMQRFIFLGFPPHKKGRETFFKEIAALNYPVVYYESPHRVLKNLELLKNLTAGKKIILGRELTKMFEEIVRGTPEEALEYFRENPKKVKGEFTIIIC